MEAVIFLAPFILIGIATLHVAFSGGPARTRQAHLTRGKWSFRLGIAAVYLSLGVALPAIVIASSGGATGGTPELATEKPSEDLKRGKQLFLQACASCHSLAAVNARGVTGPSLDELGGPDRKRVLRAIEVGGTRQNRMPKGLLRDQDAKDVAAFVAEVARR